VRGLLILLLVTAVASATPADEVLERVNHFRAVAGLEPVTLDAQMSRYCAEHAEYLRRNDGTAALEGLDAHRQRSALPGASPTGAICGRHADLVLHAGDPVAVVDGFMNTLYHRIPILRPALKSIGVGFAALPDHTLMAALMFDTADDAHMLAPVRFPARDQVDVPLAFDGEDPDPVPHGAIGGYPITLQFPTFDKVTNVHASLVANGHPVPFYESDPEHLALPDFPSGAVCLIPKQPLVPLTRYTVTIEATWRGISAVRTWSFTTRASHGPEVAASNPNALHAAIGKPSRVTGSIAYGGLTDSETAYLMLGDGSVSMAVFIPMEIWDRMAGAMRPSQLGGRVISIEGTLQHDDRDGSIYLWGMDAASARFEPALRPDN
jgi:hypothetical protein